MVEGRPSGSDTDSRFVCINNNDNSGGGETPVTPVPPEPPEVGCDNCFINNLDDIELPALELALAGSTHVDLEGFCEFLSDLTMPDEQKILELGRLFISANIRSR